MTEGGDGRGERYLMTRTRRYGSLSGTPSCASKVVGTHLIKIFSTGEIDMEASDVAFQVCVAGGPRYMLVLREKAKEWNWGRAETDVVGVRCWLGEEVRVGVRKSKGGVR